MADDAKLKKYLINWAIAAERAGADTNGTQAGIRASNRRNWWENKVFIEARRLLHEKRSTPTLPIP